MCLLSIATALYLQVFESGHKTSHDGKVVTIFSAPRYPAGGGTNQGAIAVLQGGEDCKYTIYQQHGAAADQPSAPGGNAEDEEPSVYAGGVQELLGEEVEQQEQQKGEEEEKAVGN
jgi:hypothetical protein